MEHINRMFFNSRMMNIFMGVLRKYKFNGIVTINDYSKMSEQHKNYFFKLLKE